MTFHLNPALSTESTWELMKSRKVGGTSAPLHDLYTLVKSELQKNAEGFVLKLELIQGEIVRNQLVYKMVLLVRLVNLF